VFAKYVQVKWTESCFSFLAFPTCLARHSADWSIFFRPGSLVSLLLLPFETGVFLPPLFFSFLRNIFALLLTVCAPPYLDDLRVYPFLFFTCTHRPHLSFGENARCIVAFVLFRYHVCHSSWSWKVLYDTVPFIPGYGQPFFPRFSPLFSLFPRRPLPALSTSSLDDASHLSFMCVLACFPDVYCRL